MKSQHPYPAYTQLFREILSNNDVQTSINFLENMLPLISDADADGIAGGVFSDVMRNGSPEMQLVFISKFDIQDLQAHVYIEDRLSNQEKERENLDLVIKSVGLDYGALLTGAIIKGDLQIASGLYGFHGKKDFERTLNGGEIYIDDRRVELKSEVMEPVSSSVFKELMRIVEESGLSFILDHDERVIGKNWLNESKYSTSSNSYSGLYPKISSGVLLNPELMIAFSDQAQKSPFKKTFSKIPCWVREGEYEGVDGLLIFKPERSVIKEDENRRHIFTDIEFDEFPKFIKDEEFRAQDCRLTFKITPVKEYRSMIERDLVGSVLQEVVSNPVKCGFGFPDGYHLAIADIGFLQQFHVSPADSNNLRLALEYAEEFYPAKVVNNAHSHLFADTVDCSSGIGIEKVHFYNLFNSLVNKENQPYLRQIFDDSVWLEIFSGSWTLTGHDILAAKDIFGFDDRHSRFDLSKEAIDLLHSEGYKFFDGEANCSMQSASSINNPNFDTYVKFIDMGGWPSVVDKPASVADCLAMAVRKKTEQVYKCYLRHLGAERVVAEAKTDAQFKVVYEVFERGEIEPLLGKVPRQFKARHLEDDLGM